ncbi:MAG: signal recognition particle protein, partial [Acidimicrobiales bacterium]|nr:signal recognition particle protein [Acidimicrobiales bacterium]
AFDEQQAEEAAARLMEGQFTLEDFLEQMAQVKKMGSIGNLMKLMPGMPKELRNQEIDDRELARIEGIIHSMTIAERRDPKMIDGSRRQRIATGSGVTVSEVNALLSQFDQMQKMMKGLGGSLLGGGRKKKGKGKGKGGGRVTPKGGAKMQLPPSGGTGKTPFRLPGV